MLQLNTVYPITLTMGQDGKKKAGKGQLLKPTNNPNGLQHKDGMTNFAIHLSQYPELVVLDLDIQGHSLEFYKDKTYAHKTRKGWHLFFHNTYNMTHKQQKQSENMDLMLGNNWLFYNYNNPDVAQYTEYNQLPIADFPAELYDIFKVKITPDKYEHDIAAFIVEPLIQQLKKVDNLYSKGNKDKKPHWLAEDPDVDKSQFVQKVHYEVMRYTDIDEHHRMVLDRLAQDIDFPKLEDYKDRLLQDRLKNARTQFSEESKIGWRPLSDFRQLLVKGKMQYIDVTNRRKIDAHQVEGTLIRSIKGGRPSIWRNIIGEIFPTYEREEFIPQSNSIFVGNAFNLFRGFIETEEGTSHQVFLDFILETICRGNTEYYQYIINYFAHMVQKPDTLPGIAIVLHGEKGCGKDTLHRIMGKMMKENGYIPMTEETLFGKFNGPLAGALLASAEELVFSGSHKEDSKLKNLLTREYHPIEFKGLEGIRVHNYIRLVVTSNSSRPVRATKNERRYFVLQPDDSRIHDRKYWEAVNKPFDNKSNPRGRGANHLLHYLLTVDIQGFDPRWAPNTPYLGALINEDKSPLEEAIEDWWAGIDNGDTVDFKELYLDMVTDDKYMTRRQFTSKVYTIAPRMFFKLKNKMVEGKQIPYYIVEGKLKEKTDETT